MFDLFLTFSQIRQDLAANGIRVYPQKEYDEDPEEHILNERIRVMPPMLSHSYQLYQTLSGTEHEVTAAVACFSHREAQILYCALIDYLCVQESIPFAVVGTDKEHQVNGNKVLGRKTKWGIIEGKASL